MKILSFFALVVIGCSSTFSIASVTPEKIELFHAGEGGYALYRIPAIVSAGPHTVLVACEARREARSDWGHVDILIRRSEDDGRTWSDARPLIRQHDLPSDMQRNPAAVASGLGQAGAFTIGNPTWIADPVADSVHLLYCAEYSRAFIATSRDDGRSFSPPREITAAFEVFRRRNHYDWHVVATGPGHGIALATGRLIAAVWLSTSKTDAHHPSDCATIYSDDHGATWHAGEIAGRDGELLHSPNESAVVEVAPGRVMLNMRTESPLHRRAISWSPDGATNWSEPVFVDDLWDPVCMAGLTRLTLPESGHPSVLLFSNPASLAVSPGKSPSTMSRIRQNLTLRASRDGGRTWLGALVLEPGPSAYSDLAVAGDGTILCFYERGRKNAYETLTLARIDPEFVAPAQP